MGTKVKLELGSVREGSQLLGLGTPPDSMGFARLHLGGSRSKVRTVVIDLFMSNWEVQPEPLGKFLSEVRAHLTERFGPTIFKGRSMNSGAKSFVEFYVAKGEEEEWLQRAWDFLHAPGTLSRLSLEWDFTQKSA